MEKTWSDEIDQMLRELLLALATHQECRMGDPTSQLKNIEQLTYWRNTLIDQRAKACRIREVLEHNVLYREHFDHPSPDLQIVWPDTDEDNFRDK